jgi:hypothetical protein
MIKTRFPLLFFPVLIGILFFLTNDLAAQDANRSRKAVEQDFAPAKNVLNEIPNQPNDNVAKFEGRIFLLLGFSSVLLLISLGCLLLIKKLVFLRKFPPSITPYDIAVNQKTVILSMLLNLLVLPVMIGIVIGLPIFNVPESLMIIFNSVVGIGCIILVIWLFVNTFLLAQSLYVSGCLFICVWTIGFFTPIDLLILLWLSYKATKVLTASGYKVGFLGADLRQFENNSEHEL